MIWSKRDSVCFTVVEKQSAPFLTLQKHMIREQQLTQPCVYIGEKRKSTDFFENTAAEKLRSFLPSQSFFFFLPSVTLIVLHTTKKSCDEKDRLIISALIFSMF